MTFARRLVLGPCVCAAFAGCAAAPANPQAVSPEPGRALVVGWGNTVAENAEAAFRPAQGTHISALYVSRVNDRKIPLGENIARLSPGDYDLTISCVLYIGYRNFSDDTVVHASLSGNRIYRLRAQPEGRRCEPSIEEGTGAGQPG